LTRGSAPGPRWGLCPQTSVIGSCSALAMVPLNHWCPPTTDPSAAYAVCVCFSIHAYLRNYASDLQEIFVHGRGSVLLWRRSDTLCTSGFKDDVIFAHKPRLLDVAVQLKRIAHAALGLAIKLMCELIPVAGQRTHVTTFRALKVTPQAATPGAESALYDCLVIRPHRIHRTDAAYSLLRTSHVVGIKFDMPFGAQTRGRRRNHESDKDAHWRHLVNTMDRTG